MSLIISFEGNDGSGKSSIYDLTSKWLADKGISFTAQRDPGGPSICEQIREILLNPKNEKLSKQAELLLYCAARAQLVEEAVKPAKDSNEIVLLDRFYHSTMVYQGFVNGTSLAVIDVLNDFTTYNDKYGPDITFFIVVDPYIGLSRKHDKHKDRFDSKDVHFHKKVYDGFVRLYSKLIEDTSKQYYLIDSSNLAVEEVYETVIAVLDKVI